MEQMVDTLSNDSPELSAPNKSQQKLFTVGVLDYLGGFKKLEMLLYMAYADIRRRYRRTVLGPFWTTLSLAIFILSMGTLFSLLWHTPIRTFLPFFSSGYIVWTFFSTMVTDSCVSFTMVEGYIKQISMPYSFYAFLVVWRNFLVFLHQIVVYILIAIIFRVHLTASTALLIPGLLLFVLNCSWIAIALGLLCARFRDIQQVVTSALQISMFVTPIFWPVTQLANAKAIFACVKLNLVYHFIAVVRSPLLGQAPTLLNWGVDIIVLIVGWGLTMYFLSRTYNKLVYWL